MAARRERALKLIGRAQEGEEASGEHEARLQAVPEAFVANELARLESTAEERIDQASERVRADLVETLVKEAEGLWQGIADAQGDAERRLHEEIESRISSETERLAALSRASGEIVETRLFARLDERLGNLEGSIEARLDKRVGARLESLDGVVEGVRSEADRLRAEFETASQAIIERAGALVFEQVRRADASELERTRVARAALKGLGDEVERVRETAMGQLEAALIDAEARQARFEEAQGEARGRFEQDAMRRIEASLAEHAENATRSISEQAEQASKSVAEHADEASKSMAEQADEAAKAMAERLEQLEMKTTTKIEVELQGIREACDAEVRALAARAGLVVYERIQSADSRVEAAVQALARDVDSMRSALRAAASLAEEEPRAGAQEVAEGVARLEAAAEAAAPRRWSRLRRTFRRAA